MTKAQARAACAHLQIALAVELTCSSELPGDYRRDFFRAEMKALDSSAAELLLESVMARLDDADPLAVLLGWSGAAMGQPNDSRGRA
ncbi:hypothetical protein [Reyranella sp.]|uniref:hypothetical protein n=1 Tax=Reyranella sp. TaxID=1929291 RepID=UPI003D0F7431